MENKVNYTVSKLPKDLDFKRFVSVWKEASTNKLGREYVSEELGLDIEQVYIARRYLSEQGVSLPRMTHANSKNASLVLDSDAIEELKALAES